MSGQLRVKAGDRVEIVIPSENLKFEADKAYPHHGTGTIIDYIDKKGHNHGCVNSLGMAYVQLDVPFKRTALLDDGGDPEKKKGPKFKMMKEMWVPTWFPLDFLQPEK